MQSENISGFHSSDCHSCVIQPTNSTSCQGNHEAVLTSVSPPIPFYRESTRKVNCPRLPISLLATIRKSVAAQIDDYKQLPWTETPEQSCEWEDIFDALRCAVNA